MIIGGSGPDIRKGQNILTPSDVEIVDLASRPRLTETPGSLPEDLMHIDDMVGGLVGDKPLVHHTVKSPRLSGC